MQGPIEVGRCANREANKCCAGSSWDCQAPGSTCSCDQVKKSLEKLPYTRTDDLYHMSHMQCAFSWYLKKVVLYIFYKILRKNYIFATVKSRIVSYGKIVQFWYSWQLNSVDLPGWSSSLCSIDRLILCVWTKNLPLWNLRLFSPTKTTRFPTKISLRPG